MSVWKLLTMNVQEGLMLASGKTNPCKYSTMYEVMGVRTTMTADVALTCTRGIQIQNHKMHKIRNLPSLQGLRDRLHPRTQVISPSQS